MRRLIAKAVGRVPNELQYLGKARARALGTQSEWWRRLVTTGRQTRRLLRWNPNGSCGSTFVVPTRNQSRTQGISGGNMIAVCATSSITTLNWVRHYNCRWRVPFAMVGGHWVSQTRCVVPSGRVFGISKCLRRSSQYGGRSAIMWSQLANGQVNVVARYVAVENQTQPKPSV